jgi:hypothetical protein
LELSREKKKVLEQRGHSTVLPPPDYQLRSSLIGE